MIRLRYSQFSRHWQKILSGDADVVSSGRVLQKKIAFFLVCFYRAMLAQSAVMRQ